MKTFDNVSRINVLAMTGISFPRRRPPTSMCIGFWKGFEKLSKRLDVVSFRRVVVSALGDYDELLRFVGGGKELSSKSDGNHCVRIAVRLKERAVVVSDLH